MALVICPMAVDVAFRSRLRPRIWAFLNGLNMLLVFQEWFDRAVACVVVLRHSHRRRG
ncbi:hypothetical protein LX81_03783 [Palleronia aestuarii]|uniref:Uncharacterized protein n=1 Tax=Palleronia aestuarii TaxID=568105 RepID=A0A2W7N0E9_9RHOB|nr:hypothetical protein LX81_03783 [Palleronia aestuarii]